MNTEQYDLEEKNFRGLKIIEIKVEDYECQELITSDMEEQRITKPWKNEVIVKMLGRRIGYKVLEKILN